MKKLSLILAIAGSIFSSVALAGLIGPIEGKLKDGTEVKIDEHDMFWLVKDGKGEKAADGSYEVWKDEKEWKLKVKEGKAWK